MPAQSLAAVGLLSLAVASPVAPAGLDCRAAQAPAAAAVCADVRLGRMDRRLTRLHGWLAVALEGDDLARLEREQRRFLVLRNACGGGVACLEAVYRMRIDDLAGRLGALTRSDPAPPPPDRVPAPG